MRRENAISIELPPKGVLFLGGHQNMTKKLRQQFPKWTFVTDDQLKRCSSMNQTVVFYWATDPFEIDEQVEYYLDSRDEG